MRTIAFILLAQTAEPQITVRPEIQKILDTAPAWPAGLVGALLILWCVASFFIPFFLWGIYSQNYKQTKLLRGIIDELRRHK